MGATLLQILQMWLPQTPKMSQRRGVNWSEPKYKGTERERERENSGIIQFRHTCPNDRSQWSCMVARRKVASFRQGDTGSVDIGVGS